MRTQKEIDQAITNFETEIKKLLELGYNPKQAVKKAYEAYPVMQLMKPTLQADLTNSFIAGYGNDVPYSTKSISIAMAESWAADNLTLSSRLYGRSKSIKQSVADTLTQAFKTNKAVRDTAKSIFDGYGNGGIIPESSLPKFINDLTKLNITGSSTPEGKQLQRKVLRSVRDKVSRLTTPGVRAAYTELTHAIDKGNEERINKALETAVQEKTRYNAERIARTENARAYADGQVNRYMNDDDVVAYKWRLAARHPRFDICDFYANADLYGLGKGVYPKDKLPPLPAHPHCMCHIQPLTELDIQENKQHKGINQAGLDYIQTLTKPNQEVLLGVNGRNTVLSGKGFWQDFARGWTSDIFNARVPAMLQEMPKHTLKLHPPKGSHINSDYIIDTKVINNKAYRDKYNELGYSKDITRLIFSECIACLNAANGYNRERGIMIDLATKKVGKENIGEIGSNNVGIFYPNNDKTPINQYVVIHNHPKNITFSVTDIKSYLINKCVHSAVLVDGLGNVYQIKNINRNIEASEVVKYANSMYNMYKQHDTTYNAMKTVISDLVRKGVFEYEEK